jgi:hypothetical protein
MSTHALDLTALNTLEEESHVSTPTAHQDSPVKSAHLAKDLLDLHDVEDAEVASQHDESVCVAKCTAHTEACPAPSNKVSGDDQPSNAQTCPTAAESKQRTLAQEVKGSCKAPHKTPRYVEALPQRGAPLAGPGDLSNDAHMLQTTDAASNSVGEHAVADTGETANVPPGMQSFTANPACVHARTRRHARITCSHRQPACLRRVLLRSLYCLKITEGSFVHVQWTNEQIWT